MKPKFNSSDFQDSSLQCEFLGLALQLHNEYGEYQPNALFHPDCYNTVAKPPSTNSRHVKFDTLLAEAYTSSLDRKKAVI